MFVEVAQTKWLLEKLIEVICCSPAFIHQCVRLYLCLGHANNPLKAVCESGLRDFDLLLSKHCPHLWSFRAGGVKCFFKYVFFFCWEDAIEAAVSHEPDHQYFMGSLQAHYMIWTKSRGDGVTTRLAADCRLAWLAVCRPGLQHCAKPLSLKLILLELIVEAWRWHHFLFWFHF